MMGTVRRDGLSEPGDGASPAAASPRRSPWSEIA